MHGMRPDSILRLLSEFDPMLMRHSPITTYDGQGITVSGCNAAAHTAICSHGEPPRILPEEMTKGMTKDPRCIPQHPKGLALDSMSKPRCDRICRFAALTCLYKANRLDGSCPDSEPSFYDIVLSFRKSLTLMVLIQPQSNISGTNRRGPTAAVSKMKGRLTSKGMNHIRVKKRTCNGRSVNEPRICVRTHRLEDCNHIMCCKSGSHKGVVPSVVEFRLVTICS
jgi:hypothetical protein